jgi:hypothetical protein
MSRHHVLPPLVHVPQPTPKKIENRKRRVQVGGAGTVEDMDEVGETWEATAIGWSGLSVTRPPPQNWPAIEGPGSKPQHPGGRLSEDTLKAILQAQELK